MKVDLALAKAVADVAKEAGAAILRVYEGAIAVEEKSDGTPLTLADRKAHETIAAGLQALTPGVPVLSEEGRKIPYTERAAWQSFWLVDPLDGTKEFVKRNGEFTVNIALVVERRALWGVVYAPATGLLYQGGEGNPAIRTEGTGAATPLRAARGLPVAGFTVVKSRSHPSPEVETYLKRFHVASEVSVGSSLKFCAVAEGRAHLYPRFGPTMEWDTGAGQAVLEGAGGVVLTPEGEPLRYNKSDLRNPFFLAASERGYLFP